MSIVRRLTVLSLIVVALAAGLAGCDNISNNDQGTSFLALGFFEDGTGDAGDNGTIVAIFEDAPGSQGVFPLFVPIDKNPDEDGIQGGFIGMENRLTSQFIRVVRVDCDHEVPGASIAIPSDAWAMGTVIAPSDPESTAASQAFAQIEIVSPDVMQFLNVNRASLPELPFRMVSTCSATGVTQAGDTLTTNPVFYTIQFADAPEPGAATFVGVGSGGTPSITGSNNSSSISAASTSTQLATEGDMTEVVSGSDVTDGQFVIE